VSGDGDEWLVRGPGRYVPNASVGVVSAEKARVLEESEYCVVLNPIDRATGKIQEGKRRVIAGSDSRRGEVRLVAAALEIHEEHVLLRPDEGNGLALRHRV
jgi:hypothetical protein